MQRLILLSFSLLFLATPLHAQWRPEGVPVCDTTTGASYLYPYMVSDGRGGCYIGWNDFRNGTDHNIYAQHLDSNGIPLWGSNGRVICDAPQFQQRNLMATDGKGGVFFTWTDDRSQVNSFIYAQYIDSSGSFRWQSNGVLAAEEAGIGCIPVSDGQGGLLLLYTKTYSVVAQRLDSLGQRVWGDSGIVQNNGGGFVRYWGITDDGSGGGIITWIQGGLVFGQYIRANGSLHWGQSGTLVSGPTTNAGVVGIVSDGYGGAVVAWTLDTTTGVYAQRVDSNGTKLWGVNGVYVGNGGTGTNGVISDGKGGAIILVTRELHRLRPDGTQVWPGGAVYTPSVDQAFLVSDSASGACILFSKPIGSGQTDIFAQRVDSIGIIRWASGGVHISTYTSDKLHPAAAPTDNGGVIGTWDDYRTWPDHISVYAGKVDSGGMVVPVREENNFFRPDKIKLLQNFPNPFNSSTRISYVLASRTTVRVVIYDVLGRVVRVLLNGEQQEPGEHAIEWNGEDETTRTLSSGVYFYKLQTPAGTQVKKMIFLQ